MSPSMIRAEAWAPHPSAAPVNDRSANEPTDGQYESATNGTLSCCGGWQFLFADVIPGHRYRISFNAVGTDLEESTDALVGHIYWGEIATDCYAPGTATVWDYVTGEPDASAGGSGGQTVRFSSDLVAPANVSTATVRCTLRWTARGEVTWSVPVLEDLGAYTSRPSIRVAVASGSEAEGGEPRSSVADNLDRYASLAERACGDHGAQLVALPEICLQWKLPTHAYENAVDVPGAETERLSRIAQQHNAVIVVGLHERVGDAVYNSAVVIDDDGEISGTYRKVHLASTEAISGIMPGDGFPVMKTVVGQVGCTICMDSSAAESARMVGLNGADFLVLPIMGDHRASLWTPGSPRLDEDRWLCIQRTRALDNQLSMVVARNMGRGSCIIDRSGEVKAYNDGSQDLVVGDIEQDDGYRKWNGGCFRQVNWRQRRPHLYGAYGSSAPEALRRLREVPTA